MTPEELHNTSVCVTIALGFRLRHNKGCSKEQLIKESLRYGKGLKVTRAQVREYIGKTPVQLMASLPQPNQTVAKKTQGV